jgi:hypothetical protein
VAREFPNVGIELPARGPAGVQMSAREWFEPSFDGWALDRMLDRAGAGPRFAVIVIGPHEALPRVAIELLTRCQRLVRRRNRHSTGRMFDAVLERHRAVHDLSLPLVQADYDHALDVWQWLLRLAPEASRAVQIAGLFHDIERLVSEPERRIEQHAADYQAFKDRHGVRGAELAATWLRELGLAPSLVADVVRLIAGHERRANEHDAALLADADALSFFSLNSAGFADYHDPEHTRMKVAYSLDRMRPSARRWLAHARLRADIRAMLAAA